MDIFAEEHYAVSHPLKAMSKGKYRVLVFTVLWLGFGSTYLVKKPLGIIKSDIAHDLGLTKFQLGMLDTALMLPYSVMQLVLASSVDQLGPRKTLVTCFIIAGASMSIFGIGNFYPLCLMLLFTCGTALAPTWPACSKALASLFDKHRDTIFGIFSTATSVGGILGTGLAVWIQNSYGWHYVHVIPSITLIVFALVVYAVVRSPEELGLNPTKTTTSQSTGNWWKLWRIPLIPEITLAVFTLKVVRYSMYMWLPLFLLEHLGYDKVHSGLMATVFEVGGAVGSALIGFLTAKLFSGRSFVTLCIVSVLSAVSLLLFIVTADLGPAANIVCLFMAGATNSGPDCLLSGSIPAKLGERQDSGAALTGNEIVFHENPAH